MRRIVQIINPHDERKTKDLSRYSEAQAIRSQRLLLGAMLCMSKNPGLPSLQIPSDEACDLQNPAHQENKVFG
jgi:hypothetical protein